MCNTCVITGKDKQQGGTMNAGVEKMKNTSKNAAN
jgi:hypothetical protein